MILDTSALIAILQNEPERNNLLDAIEKADLIKIASATVLEASIVMKIRHGEEGVKHLHEFLTKINAEEVPFTSEHRQYAEVAYAAYGKGQNHKAQLNFGDCFSYGLSKCMDEPLLFIGSDFAHTDIKPVKIE
ncbi:MAG: type II toxin-antitoxin system VapC family toxin [Candidatus Omnitrophota bacterium]|jgi:ribonuclease VapC|nr:MAG: type II toxin-antitoxin system VapC family toxin [Candidatus Omnitrophota bacterium]